MHINTELCTHNTQKTTSTLRSQTYTLKPFVVKLAEEPFVKSTHGLEVLVSHARGADSWEKLREVLKGILGEFTWTETVSSCKKD